MTGLTERTISSCAENFGRQIAFLRQSANSDKSRQRATSIEHVIKTMAELINSMLDVSALEAGCFRLRPRRVTQELCCTKRLTPLPMWPRQKKFVWSRRKMNLESRCWQTESEYSRKHEMGGGKGTGFGLFIAKAIIDAHGGRIWVETEADRGAKFHFTLPLAESDHN